jgi:hypothetical protein
LQSPSDPSQADTTAGFTYAFDCGSGFGAYSTKASTTCTASGPGTQTVRGRIRDKDGGVSTYSGQVDVKVTVQSVCNLTVTYIESSAKYKALPPLARKAIDALAHAACAKLGTLPTPKPSQKAAEVAAYTAAVKALVSLGWLTPAQAAQLIADAKAL